MHVFKTWVRYQQSKGNFNWKEQDRQLKEDLDSLWILLFIFGVILTAIIFVLFVQYREIYPVREYHFRVFKHAEDENRHGILKSVLLVFDNETDPGIACRIVLPNYLKETDLERQYPLNKKNFDGYQRGRHQSCYLHEVTPLPSSKDTEFLLFSYMVSFFVFLYLIVLCDYYGVSYYLPRYLANKQKLLNRLPHTRPIHPTDHHPL